mgnify:FL=1|tara:strand:+ start:31 stop:435 length:405 start_codon:yes stop_codon:yes gene_type:complete
MKEERIETKNEDGEVIYIHETFIEKQDVALSGSFGTVKEEDGVSLTVHMNYDYGNKHGTFEFYKTGTEEWHGCGGLWVDENNELVDYDGVYSLMPFVLDWLQGVGVNVSDMRECLFGKKDTETSLLKAESKEEE